ncbi:MAG: hypothetical protein FWG02_01795 [Holophagaceae bacterium]|nr:hypothetical protein [Holophagaceae bacterium]
MIFKTSRYLLLGLGVGLFVNAQEPTWGFGLKVGAGIGQASTNEQVSNMSVHMAFTAQYKIDSKSAFIGELKYIYFKADDWENPMFEAHATKNFYSAGEMWLDHLQPGTKVWSSMYYSIDYRKSDLDGLVFGFGYKRSIMDTKWSWQAGIKFDWLKSQDQTQGHVGLFEDEAYVNSRPANDPGDEIVRWVALNGKNTIKPGVFAGITGFVSENVFVECNLSTIAYTQPFYTPYVYTGNPSTVVENSRNKIVLEFSAGFKF